ncbi:unnamed protein product [Darwinula stevensoni]|uniref:Uncharacterized protein n=1 Tax=Darwinula stevensoni TaxID=69355 RepID=A0A7R9A2R3_9CRUS|nr:unnamed protein product [Darwinula stevensoni]CAG0890230.1 unnamed protein product [Darwinula stevensoni]
MPKESSNGSLLSGEKVDQYCWPAQEKLTTGQSSVPSGASLRETQLPTKDCQGMPSSSISSDEVRFIGQNGDNASMKKASDKHNDEGELAFTIGTEVMKFQVQSSKFSGRAKRKMSSGKSRTRWSRNGGRNIDALEAELSSLSEKWIKEVMHLGDDGSVSDREEILPAAAAETAKPTQPLILQDKPLVNGMESSTVQDTVGKIPNDQGMVSVLQEIEADPDMTFLGTWTGNGEESDESEEERRKLIVGRISPEMQFFAMKGSHKNKQGRGKKKKKTAASCPFGEEEEDEDAETDEDKNDDEPEEESVMNLKVKKRQKNTCKARIATTPITINDLSSLISIDDTPKAAEILAELQDALGSDLGYRLEKKVVTPDMRQGIFPGPSRRNKKLKFKVIQTTEDIDFRNKQIAENRNKDCEDPTEILHFLRYIKEVQADAQGVSRCESEKNVKMNSIMTIFVEGGKSFRHQFVLFRHLAIHFHDRHFTCEHCGRSFKQGPCVIVDEIKTKNVQEILARKETPFALLKPLEGMPVLCKVIPYSDGRQMLMPATAEELKSSGKVISPVPDADCVGKGIPIQIQVPVVAHVVQEVRDGSLLTRVVPPPCGQKDDSQYIKEHPDGSYEVLGHEEALKLVQQDQSMLPNTSYVQQVVCL